MAEEQVGRKKKKKGVTAPEELEMNGVMLTRIRH